jgi:hypothetical protein
MGYVGVACLPQLTGVGLSGHLVGTTQQIQVAIGMMSDEGLDDIIECRLALLSRR